MTAKPGPYRDGSDQLSVADRRRIADFVTRETGIQLPESKHQLVEVRLRKRQRALGLPSIKHYVNYALDNSAQNNERGHLFDALTTNKTQFYREANHFTLLRQYVEQGMQSVDDVITHSDGYGDSELAVWSAGCSTGQEAYTLAFELMELQQGNSDFHFSIAASDISSRCLEHAARATYKHQEAEQIPLALRKKYLLRSKGGEVDRVRMAPEVTRHVRFFNFNLLRGNYSAWTAHYDVIFCRNVMIYFSHEDRAKIVAKLASCLKPGGLLFVGHSESIVDVGKSLSRLQPAVYRKRQ